MFHVGDDDSDDDMNDEVVNADGEIHTIPLTREMLRVRAREKIKRDEVERDRLAMQVRGRGCEEAGMYSYTYTYSQ
jgi:hypothetical protein